MEENGFMIRKPMAEVKFELHRTDYSTEEELHAKIKELSARYSEGYALRIVVD